MIASRTLLAAVAVGFAFLLGIFAIYRNPKSRLNRFFFLYVVTSAFCFLPGTMFIERVYGHTIALLSYRTVQWVSLVAWFAFFCFVDELTGRISEREGRAIRRASFAVIAACAPLYASGLVIADFAIARESSDVLFTRIPGPLYALHILLFCVFAVGALVLALKRLRTSVGIRRNQIRFVLFGLALGFLAFAFGSVPTRLPMLSLLTFPLLVLMLFCFAYAMFKHGLFEFDLWMKRLSIYAGVYLAVCSLPILMFFPFRDWLPRDRPFYWPLLTAVVIGYGVLFSLAPMVTSYLRQQTERKRWAQLRERLDAVQRAGRELSDEAGVSLGDIAERTVALFREFYDARMKTPLRFVFAAVQDAKGAVAVGVAPPFAIDKSILSGFLASVADLPDGVLQRPFSPFELDAGLSDERDVHAVSPVRTVRAYLVQNGVEFCCPCLHNGKTYGAILLGPKTSGVFSPEELATLQMTAGHVAVAVRKSELLSAARELKDLDALKSQLISNITHEFKSPLNVISGGIDVLLAEVKEGRVQVDRLRDYLVMLKNNAGKLSIFIQNLLDVARIENAKIDLRPVPADLAELVRDVARLFEPLIRQKGLNLFFDLPPSLPVRVDADKISQVVANLLSNAIKFTDDGWIRVSLSGDGAASRIAVRDSGRGIDPRYRDRVFDKFFQTPDGESEGGTGLGLAIARGWTAAHGGRIWAESDGVGKGAAFFVDLPAGGMDGDASPPDSKGDL